MSSVTEIFAAMNEAVQGENGKALQKRFKGTVVFTVAETNEQWSLDLKNAQGKFSVKKGMKDIPKPDLSITMSKEDLIKLFNQKLNPQQAVVQGKIKLKGKIPLAMKLTSLLSATRKMFPQSKL